MLRRTAVALSKKRCKVSWRYILITILVCRWTILEQGEKEMLDAEEQLHLGLHAIKENNPQAAIEHFKECLINYPDHPKATYLLGAIYAQIGMYERAKDLLQKAIAINPSEFTGRFQLGLLHLTSGDVELAKTVWQEVDALGANHYLSFFKSAMLALVEDNFELCVDLIDKGVANNNDNASLNDDMQKVRVAAEEALAKQASVVSGSTPGNVSHLVLTGYQQAQQDTDK
jgi:tetratricopeptide (TPR) repeat protein